MHPRFTLTRVDQVLLFPAPPPILHQQVCAAGTAPRGCLPPLRAPPQILQEAVGKLRRQEDNIFPEDGRQF